MKNIKRTLAIIFATITMGACLSTNAAIVDAAENHQPTTFVKHEPLDLNYGFSSDLQKNGGSMYDPDAYGVSGNSVSFKITKAQQNNFINICEGLADLKVASFLTQVAFLIGVPTDGLATPGIIALGTFLTHELLKQVSKTLKKYTTTVRITFTNNGGKISYSIVAV
ncbi:MAG: hypothetical protein LBN08_04355 [Lactobacillales bacterium]|jgi:hypothetical protein|nr:hypothetical protein [Lactobacillales bacterium]